jgi:hypothetical protein
LVRDRVVVGGLSHVARALGVPEDAVQDAEAVLGLALLRSGGGRRLWLRRWSSYARLRLPPTGKERPFRRTRPEWKM